MNKENRKTLPQKKNFNKNDEGGSFNTSSASDTQLTYFECQKKKKKAPQRRQPYP